MFQPSVWLHDPRVFVLLSWIKESKVKKQHFVFTVFDLDHFTVNLEEITASSVVQFRIMRSLKTFKLYFNETLMNLCLLNYNFLTNTI